MYREFIDPNSRANKWFIQSGLSENLFGYLFYVYNRGGVFSSHTIVQYSNVTKMQASRIIKTLLGQRWIKCIIPREYHSDFHIRNAPQLYRVANKFLRLIENPNSSINKIGKLSPSIRFLNTAQFFLEPSYREWKLVDRRNRVDYLLKTFGLSEGVLPRYWVGRNLREGVISINHELAIDPTGRVNVVFISTNTFTIEVEFKKHLLQKWKELFDSISMGPEIGILAISDTPSSKLFFDAYLKTKPPLQQVEEKPKPQLTDIQQFIAYSRGEQETPFLESTTSSGIFSRIVHVNYPNYSEAYGIFKCTPKSLK